MVKVANTIGRYLIVYLAVAFLFTLYSTLLDLLFYRLDYGSAASYEFLPNTYFLYFAIGYLYPALPTVVFYNYAINNIFINTYVRLIIGLLLGLSIGFLIQRSGISLYIGHLRPVKNIILYSLIGISVEILRIIKSKYVTRTRIKKNAWINNP